MMKSINDQPIIKFQPKLAKLSKNEQQVLTILVEAAELLAPIYLDQEKQAQVNPDREEIQRAAKNDPALLSPYTVVEKLQGRLVATPYHIKYAPLLKPITDKLIKASEITSNRSFGKLLKLQAKSLLDGSYHQAIAASIKFKPFILDISIGPNDYFNRLFGGKAVYQAWVGILDVERTKRINDYKRVVFYAQRKALVPNERIENFDLVKAKAIDEVILSGLMARTKFVGMSLPMDIEWIKKYGTEVTIFNQANDLRMTEQILPSFRKIFSPGFQGGFSEEDLKRGSLLYVALHELAHNYLYYKNAIKNLEDLFSAIFELTSTLLAMRIAGSLLLKDRITSKQLESMIVAFVSRSFDLIEKSKKDRFLSNYAVGGSIFINYMLESGAIKQQGGMAITNFTKIFLSLHELSYIMERLLSSATKKEAEEFIKKYQRSVVM